MKEILVKNPTRSRKWGWGYSTTPTGKDPHSIVPPSAPDHVGTFNQIFAAITNDPTWASFRNGGTFTSTRWFYDGRPIIECWHFGMIKEGTCHCSDIAPGDYCARNCYYDNAEYGEAWWRGFTPDRMDSSEGYKIKVA